MKKLICLLCIAVTLISCNGNQESLPPGAPSAPDSMRLSTAITTDTLKDFVNNAFNITDPKAKKLLRQITNDEPQLLAIFTTDPNAPYSDSLHKQRPLFNEEDFAYDLNEPLDPYKPGKPQYNIANYDVAAFKTFTQFANETHGAAYVSNYAGQLPNILIDILNNHATTNTDVLFLIDNTGSMSDDIISIQYSLSKIITCLKKLKNVNVGWASYGDSIYDGKQWFILHPLTEDLDVAIQGINNIRLTAGGDMPESVNDAVVRAANETNWRKGSKRMIILLGDAPSQEPPRAKYSHAEVVQHCIKNNIWVNIFPVIINLMWNPPNNNSNAEEAIDTTYTIAPIVDATVHEKLTGEFIKKIYPIPATDNLTIELSRKGHFRMVITSMTGGRMLDENMTSTRQIVDVSHLVPATYLLTILDLDNNTQHTQVFVKQ